MANISVVENEHGVRAYQFSDEVTLRRLVLAAFLTEDSVELKREIAALIPNVNPIAVHEIAVSARKEFALRKVPLFVAREMARSVAHRKFVADTLEQVIERPDELGAFLELYWGGAKAGSGREPLPRQVRLGLARAFAKFNEYALSRYDRKSASFSMQDIIRIAHPAPTSPEQAELYHKIAKGIDLPAVDDWEHELSSSTDKLASWNGLIQRRRLGGLALLKNLRNMIQAGVSETDIVSAVQENIFKYVLPFRFISATRELERSGIKISSELRDALEAAMLHGLADFPRLLGDTVFLVDVSGSMQRDLGLSFTDRRGRSVASPMTRSDGASSLAMLLREVCESPLIYKFHTRIHEVKGRGFELGKLLQYENQGTTLGACLLQAKHDMELRNITPKRLIVLTDEESQDEVGAGFAEHNYLINVKSAKHSVGFGPWVRLVGFSEHIVRMLVEHEQLDAYIAAHKG